MRSGAPVRKGGSVGQVFELPTVKVIMVALTGARELHQLFAIALLKYGSANARESSTPAYERLSETVLGGRSAIYRV